MPIHFKQILLNSTVRYRRYKILNAALTKWRVMVRLMYVNRFGTRLMTNWKLSLIEQLKIHSNIATPNQCS